MDSLMSRLSQCFYCLLSITTTLACVPLTHRSTRPYRHPESDKGPHRLYQSQMCYVLFSSSSQMFAVNFSSSSNDLVTLFVYELSCK